MLMSNMLLFDISANFYIYQQYGWRFRSRHQIQHRVGTVSSKHFAGWWCGFAGMFVQKGWITPWLHRWVNAMTAFYLRITPCSSAVTLSASFFKELVKFRTRNMCESCIISVEDEYAKKSKTSMLLPSRGSAKMYFEEACLPSGEKPLCSFFTKAERPSWSQHGIMPWTSTTRYFSNHTQLQRSPWDLDRSFYSLSSDEDRWRVLQ